MKDLKIVNGKMSTLQFAELTGTAHKNVLAKARKLLDDLGIRSAQFCADYLDAQGNIRGFKIKT